MEKMTTPVTIELMSLREEQVRLTQQRILDTFENELLDRGYAEVSIRSVAKRAGISVPTVYRHYPNKEALLMALMESTQNENGFDFYGALTDVSDPQAAFARLVDGLWNANEARPGRTKAILHAIAAPGETGTGQVVSEIVKRFAFMARESVSALSYLPHDELRKLEAFVALMLSRPTWERLRYGHNLPRDLAQDAVIEAVNANIDSLTSRYKRPAHVEYPRPLVASEDVVKERFASATKEL